MPVKQLRDFLNSNNIKYVTISHSPAYTAQAIAASAHVSGKELAKTVMVKLDGKMAMAVLPASFQVDFDKMRRATGAENVELAGEREFKDLFPECEVGAMPPFGTLFSMDVIASKALAEDDEIAFNAGTHRELVMMKYNDFERLVKPKVVPFTVRKKVHGELEGRQSEI